MKTHKNKLVWQTEVKVPRQWQTWVKSYCDSANNFRLYGLLAAAGVVVFARVAALPLGVLLLRDNIILELEEHC